MNKTFQMTSPARVGRSVFNLSYDKKFTCDMGQLIPVVADEVVPGDIMEIANEIVIRFQPLVAPIMHEIHASVHYFFVPYRLLWDDWEDFITGGTDGEFSATLPTWTPTDNAVGSLWDYFGLPTGVLPAGAYPISFQKRAYNFIYNEFYRDQTLIAEVDIDQETVLNRCWEKDYFTSSLPWQQRGIAPALPISGTTSAVWAASSFLGSTDTSGSNKNFFSATAADTVMRVAQTDATRLVNAQGMFNDNIVDLSSATTFNVADLRLAFQVQKWLERNARAGARYTEFLRAHFGVSPRDERLDRPEYIGGTKSPIIVSEVLQTSSTDATSPQGNLAGHGINASRNFAAKYRVQEFGIIVGMMSVMPRSAYQQGINRQWLRRTRFDFYSPEFANLSEQAIENAEIYATGVDTENLGIFGYQGRYDEMRYKPSMVCGDLRTLFDYWHLGRIFGSAPLLNEAFVTCVPSKRVFAVQDEPGLIVNIGNLIKAVRPLPVVSNPGYIDH